MRSIMILIIASTLVAFASAGCLSAPAEPVTDEEPDPQPAVQTEPPLPEDIEVQQDIGPSADPGNFAGAEICGDAAECHRYPFSLEGKAKLTAVLSWSLPANDLDLYLYEDGAQFEISGESPPTTTEQISTSLSRGDYELVVVGWLVSADTFELSATFS